MKKVRHRETFGRPPIRPKAKLDLDHVAAQALAYLAADPERLGRFLALTGVDPSTIRSAASQPGFSAAIVSYLASDEALLVDFASSHGLDPVDVGGLAQESGET